MSGVPTYNPYEGDLANAVSPFRPTIDTMGGASKVNAVDGPPPDPTTEPSAEEDNLKQKLCVSFGAVTAVARIYIKIVAGDPIIFGIRAASSSLQASDFTITDNGLGDTTIQCPSTKLIQPFAGAVFPQTTSDFRAVANVLGTADGIRIVTRNAAGTAADCDFLLDWI